MTTKDKSREKLLNSMRKTKEVINDQPDTKQVHAETYAAAASKSAKTSKSGKKTTPSKARQDAPIRSGPATDPYQSRGRVWPD